MSMHMKIWEYIIEGDGLRFSRLLVYKFHQSPESSIS